MKFTDRQIERYSRQIVLKKVGIIGQKKLLKSRCYIYENDISDLNSIPQLTNNIEKNIGPINILINNAGMHLRKIAKFQWFSYFRQNLTAQLAMFKLCLHNRNFIYGAFLIFQSCEACIFEDI